MAKFTNPTPGARGVLLKSGAQHLIEAGKTADIDDADVENCHPDLETDWDGAPAKATTSAKPGLTNKTKEQLLQIATDEGVTIEDNATNNDIVAAIELHREDAAKA